MRQIKVDVEEEESFYSGMDDEKSLMDMVILTPTQMKKNLKGKKL